MNSLAPLDHILAADRFVAPDGTLLTSLGAINQLPEVDRNRIYRTLLHPELLDRFGIDPITLTNPSGESVVGIDASPRIGAVELKVWRQLSDRDPVIYFQLADTTNNQLSVLLFVINDPEAPRFDVDRDWGGEPTKFGTLSRNIPAEIAALQAGLAPGQIRRGLRMSRQMVPVVETFISRLGREFYFLEPLAYHTAILFESFGCTYSQGRRKMDWIHQEFQPPDGILFKRLDGSTPFRLPGAEETVRGRSWAIHDGILGEPFTDLHMYKNISHPAAINTFPHPKW
jgi:hypothetical protein